MNYLTEVKDPSKTITICWQYTEICNLNCPYCTLPNNLKHINQYKKNNKIILNKIILEATKNKNIIFFIDIEGGEPTLDKAVFDIPKKIEKLKNIKLKLFTNFYQRNNEYLNNLIKFSENHIVECSLHLDKYNNENTKNEINEYFKDFKKLLNNSNNSDNIRLSILINDLNDANFFIENVKNNFQQLKKYNVFISVAENFNELKILKTEEYNILRNYINYCRLKLNFKDYLCNCNHIDLSCTSLTYRNCSKNFTDNFLNFSAKKYIHKKFICKNNICGVHDNQLLYKKEKL